MQEYTELILSTQVSFRSHEIVLADVRADVEADMSKLTVVNKTTGVEIPVLCELTGRTKDIILAGGLLDYTREQLSK